MTPFIIGAVIVVVVLIAIAAGSSYNGFVKLRNQSDEAFSTMDVYLKKRYDLIPNLVETVKRYAIHEQETLTAVIAARNMAVGARDFTERGRGDNMITGALRSLFAVTESYPNLKADQSFLNLQYELSALENEISQARKYYNGVVKVMNNKVEMFPGNLFAGAMGFRSYPYFMADDGERNNVRVQF
ncbi:membrane protein [Clostridia bacterium]|nr:membrane protein [Clostridia bacterium]